MSAGSRRGLIVLRHGVTDHNARGIWQGHLDIPLNATGLAQARAAAHAIAALRPAFVIGSDLARAHRTAEEVADAADLDLEVDAALREIHVGRWQGLTAGEVAELFPELWAAVSAGEDLARGEDGETVAQVAQRVRPVVHAALARLEAGETAVLVSHGVTARALVADLVGLDQNAAWRSLSGLGNCHWARLGEREDGWRIDAWNVGAADLGSA
ncbi:MAG: histidine phosphatase family protein [Micrococcales bacterium]|nr:histidine phosphatase family protein [Micrococcales bacterium]